MVLIVLFILGIIGFLAVSWRPSMGIVAVILMLPLEQILLAQFGRYTVGGQLLNYMVGLLVLYAVVRKTISGQLKLSDHIRAPFFAAIGLFIIAALGILWTPSKRDAIEAFSFGVPYWGLMVILAPLLLDNIKDFRNILLPMMLTGSLLILLIVFGGYTNVYSGRLYIELGSPGDYESRGNTLALATLGAMIAVISVLYRPERTSTLINTIRLGSVLMGFGLTLLSGSRGQVLGAAICALAFFPLAREIKDIKQFFFRSIGAFFLLGLGYISLKLFVTAENVGRYDSGMMIQDIFYRFGNIGVLASEFLNKPFAWIFGLGPRAFTEYATSDQPYVHNFFAEALFEEGIAGFVCVYLLMLYTWRNGKTLFQQASDSPSLRSSTACLLALTLLLLIISLKQGSFISSPTMIMWPLLVCKAATGELRNARGHS